ncbi:hypothetical protein KsCSTR_35240 [Candidatus Kuenenia stuttgartiensis]|jgi:hypothetical protein|nr:MULTISPECIES: hypothetical protein [Kuenenia]MBE7548938.1 hypothetical protein [Planctomycetia bacterium]MBW7943559.1 hypothetical protein [Candidatus Kuenenia stuttgartiensis]MBZ0190644.1 hypothetical protein [Candidatus Kuenenia stuttgartiensis]MCF6153456.1 hypothetical protein [Candidatus Kuenenia stuttgartiensis]MCL4727269.1 hypothetical protein [Candidatus Kuenenia stuttgartiensis]
MEQIFAQARIYLIVLVFFVSCFLGLNSKVSLPALALRSIIIAGITGIISHFFLKYILSVFTTDTQKEDTEDAPEQSQINEAETDGNRGKNGGMGR